MFNNGQSISNDPSSNGKWMLDHHIMKMTEANANRDNWKYWVYFDFVLDRMLPYIDPDSRKKIDDDRVKLRETIFLIEKQGQTEIANQKQIEKLRLNFIESHKSYISLYLPKTGIIQIEETGEVNFDKQDFDKLKRVIRAGAEPGRIEDAVEAYGKEKLKKEAKDGANPSPETTQ